MSDDERKDFLCQNIVRELQDNPEWTGDVVKAVIAGTQAAMATLTQTASDCRMATMAALILAKGGRLHDTTRTACNEMLLKAIRPSSVAHLSPFEKAEFKKAFAELDQ